MCFFELLHHLKIVGAMLAGGKRLSPTVADSGDGSLYPPGNFVFLFGRARRHRPYNF